MSYVPSMPQPPPPPFIQPAPKKSVWPLVIGIIYLVVAAWAIWMFIGALITPALMGMYKKMGIPNPMPSWHSQAVILTGAIAGVAGVFALIGGIRLIRRRPSARTLLLLFAAIFAIYTIASTVVQYKAMNEMDYTATMNTPNSPPMPPEFQSMMKSMTKKFSLMGVIIGLLFHLPPPIFVVVWFSREKIRREIATWEKP